MKPAPSLLPLFLVSGAAVGYELALTRFFAVAQWSEYGYWVISIVMAGFALSGVVLAMARGWFAKRGAAWLAALPPLLVVTAGLGFHFASVNPFNPLELQNPATWTGQVGNIGLYYAALVPFFFLAGLFVGLSFVLNPDRVGTVYGFDLTGAGAGAAAITVLMFLVPPFRLVPALLVAIAAAAFVPRAMSGLTCRAGTLLALAGMEALLLFGAQAQVSQYKPIYAPLHTPGARVLATRTTPRGAYALLDDFTERLDTDVSNDAGALGLPGPPRAYGLYRDGSRIAALPSGPPDVRYAGSALDALPYILLRYPHVLLVGASGGFRVAEARSLGAAGVDALEPEPTIFAALRHGLGPTQPLPPDPRVRLLRVGALAGVEASSAPFDLIDLSADLLDASEANVAAFTVEALTADLRALAPDGIISIPASIRDFPVYALRVLATARAALEASGIPHPARHVLVYRSAWGARVLLSNTVWDAARIEAVKRFCDARSFDVSYYPGIDITAARAGIYNDLPAVSFAAGAFATGGPDDAVADEAEAVLAGRPSPSAFAFDLSPVTLDRPFFYSALRLSQLRTILARLEILPQAEIAGLVNLAVLGQALLIAALVLLVPLTRPMRIEAGNGWAMPRLATYFAALGLGFLFIEIYLIQQATLWLENASAGFALVLTSMLIFSGLGSMVSGRANSGTGRFKRLPGMRRAAAAPIAPAVMVIVLWCGAAGFGLKYLILATFGLPWAARAVLVLAITAPVSVALGLPFPLGLARLGPDNRGEVEISPARSGLLPWAWALNGAFSVLATPLANLVARQAGFQLVLFCAAALYALAFATYPALRRQRAWQQLAARLPGVD